MPQVFKRYLIAPLNEGLVNNLEPWLIPEDAFQELQNAYVWRGRVKKRWGSTYIEDNASQLSSRLRINVGTTNALGTAAGFVPVTPAGISYGLGQMFSIGTQIFTVNLLGNPATMLNSTGVGLGTFDTTTGAYGFTAVTSPLTTIYWYPAYPVMGLTQYDSSTINFEGTFAFDTTFAYQYNNATIGFERSGTAEWTGSNNQFHWSTMFANTNPDEDWLFTVNNKAFPAGVQTATSPDGIKYYESGVGNWTNFRPLLRGVAGNGLVMTGSRICLEFKGRMLFFAPYEATENPAGTIGASVQIDNRVRFSWQETLTDTANCFFEASGKGGYLDAPTSESIVTAQFVKDRLVVYFERSTYELAYRGAPDLPFIWQKLDTSLGAESTFSQVPFDTHVLGIGSNGIHSCNGANVSRIDNKIPDEVFRIRNKNDSNERVAGIRDYFNEMVYWTFPFKADGTFPEKILVYNYRNGTWSFFDDSITAWGYHTRVTGRTWATWHTLWNQSSWPWNTPSDSERFSELIAGNQEGYILRIQAGTNSNIGALQLTAIAGNTFGVINHNLSVGDYIKIENCTGSTNLNNTIVKVVSVTNANVFVVDGPAAIGTYSGGGTLSRVSNVRFETKQFNFFTKTAQNTFIPYIEYLVTRTDNGQHKTDFFVSSSAQSMVDDGTATGSQLGNAVLETYPYALTPLEASQERLWHRVYYQAVGDNVSFNLYHTDAQMKDASISEEGFQLHALILYAEADGTRLGD